jgi:indole-3-glycerol phosphate synthase/phosphoribosylanthranilate isomerase
VAESGIHSEADARRLARYDVQAMLIGESLVISPDVAAQMRKLLSGANNSTQVKICGMRKADDVDVAIEAGADMLGIIFYEPSHRYVAPRHVSALLQQSTNYTNPPNGEKAPDLVGVFVNEEAEKINEIVDEHGLAFVQLHGEETPEFCQKIKRPVIKALHVTNHNELSLMKEYEQVAWRLLLDTPTPDWGGTGQTHDWNVAKQAAYQTPILLAGGLTPKNVGNAITYVHPWGVDVSSGVETEKQRDPEKIRAFIQAVRTAY